MLIRKYSHITRVAHILRNRTDPDPEFFEKKFRYPDPTNFKELIYNVVKRKPFLRHTLQYIFIQYIFAMLSIEKEICPKTSAKSKKK